MVAPNNFAGRNDKMYTILLHRQDVDFSILSRHLSTLARCSRRRLMAMDMTDEDFDPAHLDRYVEDVKAGRITVLPLRNRRQEAPAPIAE